MTTEEDEEYVHENCGGEILSDGWTDGLVYWTCDTCGECWDDDDYFNQVKRKDFIRAKEE